MLIADYLDDLMPRLPGADEALVKHETLATVREFCEEGLAWVYNYGPVDVVADAPVLTLSPPTGTHVGYFLRTEFKPNDAGTYLPFPPSLILDPQVDGTAEQPSAYYAETPEHLHMIPVPTLTHTAGFRADISLIPVSDSVSLPDTFGTHWRESIIAGVLARMYSMQSKPWSSASEAIKKERKYRNQIRKSRDVVKRRYSTTSSTWRFPYFAAQ